MLSLLVYLLLGKAWAVVEAGTRKCILLHELAATSLRNHIVVLGIGG